MLDILSLVRPNIRRLQPYSSARSEYNGVGTVWLDANESPFGMGLNRYPDPLQTPLCSAIAQQKELATSNVLLGNGSDEIIDLLLRVFCEPRCDAILVVQPTYGMYEVCAAIHDVEVRSVMANPDFSFPLQAVQEAAQTPVKMVFLCSPNNPTGRSIPLDEVEILARSFAGIVVVDEAYIDFSPHRSAVSLLATHPNIVVLQTLSKAFGLAGARVGMMYAHQDIIAVLRSIKPPYNISVLNQNAAVECLQRGVVVRQQVRIVCAERKRLGKRLAAFSFVKEVFPSDANFLLVRMADAARVYYTLRERGVVVRNRSTQPLCANCLRISVGKAEENEVLLSLLAAMEGEV